MTYKDALMLSPISLSRYSNNKTQIDQIGTTAQAKGIFGTSLWSLDALSQSHTGRYTL